MGKSGNKDLRLLDMYHRLREGEMLRIAEEAERFGVSQRSISRDIENIRAFLDTQPKSARHQMILVYDRREKKYYMEYVVNAMERQLSSGAF